MLLFNMAKLRLMCLVSVLLLTACGFHLQGSVPLPPEFSSTYIQAGDRYTFFYQSLSKALRQRGVTLVKGPSSATAIIKVEADNSGQNVTAVSSRNIPLEYEAYYSVRFSVAVNGKQVLEPAAITLTNRYEYNQTEVLGKAEEYEVLSASQAKDIARQILVQISTL